MATPTTPPTTPPATTPPAAATPASTTTTTTTKTKKGWWYWPLIILMIGGVGFLILVGINSFNVWQQKRAVAAKAKGQITTPVKRKKAPALITHKDSIKFFQDQLRASNDSLIAAKKMIANLKPAAGRVDEYRGKYDSVQRLLDTATTKLAAVTTTKSGSSGNPPTKPATTAAVVQPDSATNARLTRLEKKVDRIGVPRRSRTVRRYSAQQPPVW